MKKKITREELIELLHHSGLDTTRITISSTPEDAANHIEERFNNKSNYESNN